MEQITLALVCWVLDRLQFYVSGPVNQMTSSSMDRAGCLKQNGLQFSHFFYQYMYLFILCQWQNDVEVQIIQLQEKVYNLCLTGNPQLVGFESSVPWLKLQ